MKKILSFVLMMVCTVLMSIGLASCHDHRTRTSDKVDAADSISIAEQIMNPTYDNTEQFVIYVINNKKNAEIDSILFQLREPVLASICDEVLRNHLQLCRQTVYDTYCKNRMIYDSMNRRLQTDPPVPNPDPDSTQNSEPTNGEGGTE